MGQKKPKKSGKNKRSRLAPIAVVLWTAAVLGFCFATSYVYDRGHEAYGALEIRLPGVLELALHTGAFLHTPTGMLLVCSAFALSLVPFALGARGTFAARTYLVLAVVVGAAAAVVWFGNGDALSSLAEKINPAKPGG